MGAQLVDRLPRSDRLRIDHQLDQRRHARRARPLEGRRELHGFGHALADANRALELLREGAVTGAAVLDCSLAP
jgi:hypothetical protein